MLDIRPLGGDREVAVQDKSSRANAWLAGAVVATIMLIGLAVLLATRQQGTAKVLPSVARPAQHATASPQPTASPATASAPPSATTVPTKAPSGVTWSLYRSVALPQSRTDGPTNIAEPVVAGFSRTPTGALIATAQIATRYLNTPGDGWRQVVAEQVLPGPGRDRYITLRSKVSVDNDRPGTYGQVAGFRYVTYGPDAAVIQVVTRFSNGRLQVVTETVRWAGGDWKLELQPDGSTSPNAQSVSSLAGFVPWGGV